MDASIYESVVFHTQKAFAHQRLILDQSGKAIDYEILDVNPAFESAIGFRKSEVVGKRMSQIVPDLLKDDFGWVSFFAKVATTGTKAEVERYVPAFGRWFRIYAFSPKEGEFVTLFSDETETKVREENALVEGRKLKRQILDLEVITYASSLAQEIGDLPVFLQTLVDEIPQRIDYQKIERFAITYGATQYASGHESPSSAKVHEELVVGGLPVGFLEFQFRPVGYAELQSRTIELTIISSLKAIITNYLEHYAKDIALSQNEARFREYFDSAPIGLLIFSADGRYKNANPTMCRLLGYSREEILGSTVADFSYPEDVPAYASGLQRLAAHKGAKGESRLRRKDGSPLLLVTEAIQISNNEFLAFCLDVTDRQKDEERKRLYLNTIESLEQAIIITDLKASIIEVNEAFLSLYGYSAQEVLGKNPHILNPGKKTYIDLGYTEEDYDSLFRDLWKSVKDPDRRSWKGTVINRRKDGVIIWADLLIDTISGDDGEPIGYVGLPIDISETRMREKTGKIELYSTIASLAELRDNETGNHMKRVGIYAKMLAKSLGMPRQYCEDIQYFAPMHDIGKVGILDSILLAPRRLTDLEFAEMKKHTILGFNIVKGKRELEMAAAITLNHHERWDGMGYPTGKEGEAIPLSARITSVADIYDALRSERPYKRAWTHEETVDEIRRLGGKQLDPLLVEKFLGLQEDFARVFATIS